MKEKPDTQTNKFLHELADLMEKYNFGELNVEESFRDYYSSVDGVFVYRQSRFENGVEVVSFVDYNMGRYITPETLREFALEEE